MENHIEFFNNFYSVNKSNLVKIIDMYNLELLKGKEGYLKENLNRFKDLNSDGKLIRGILIALGYKLSGKKDLSYSYNLSLAYEIFQTSVLIHDDIIDEDNLRRGKETIHYRKYKNNKIYNDEDAKKNGSSVAICVGDYGFFEANKIIINNYQNDKNYKDLLDYYNDIVLKTIEGELIDVELSFDGKYKTNSNIEKEIMNVYKLKTAYYTIIGPLSLGLILGGKDKKEINEIEKIGEKIGIAFQIQDDILGIYNDMGKVSGSDIKEFKQTILYAHTIENEEYKEELLKYYGKDNLEKNDIDKVGKIFKESGSYKYALDMMNDLYDSSLKELENISWIEDEDRKILKGFIEYLRKRKK